MAFRDTANPTYSAKKGQLAENDCEVRSMRFYSATSTDKVAPGEFVTMTATYEAVTKCSRVNLATAAGETNGAGIVVRDQTHRREESYSVGEMVPVLMRGSVWVEAAEPITAGNSVFVDADDGTNFHDDNSGQRVNGHTWHEAVASGALGRVFASYPAWTSQAA